MKFEDTTNDKVIYQCYKYAQLQYEFENYVEAKDYIDCYEGILKIKGRQTDEWVKMMEKMMINKESNNNEKKIMKNITKTNITFKNCPFCSSNEVQCSTDIDRKMSGFLIESKVICLDCGSKGPFINSFLGTFNLIDENSDIYKLIEAEATRLWNKRYINV